jgi:hypothetical protein
MKISKESILMLGFIIQDENPVGFRFIHPRFNQIAYVFLLNKEWFEDRIYIADTQIGFNTLDHFINSHEVLTGSKLVAHILCDPNTKFCLNQKKDA